MKLEIKSKIDCNDLLYIYINNLIIRKVQVDWSQPVFGVFKIKIRGVEEEVNWELRRVKSKLVLFLLPLNLFQSNKINVAEE
jgi:hypothetical protein